MSIRCYEAGDQLMERIIEMLRSKSNNRLIPGRLLDTSVSMELYIIETVSFTEITTFQLTPFICLDEAIIRLP